MSTLKVSNFARQGYSIVFPLFLFFSAIFCMSTRTNNLLHLSILLLLLSLVRQENRQALAGVLREQWQTWTLLAAFFIYYALSNVWGHTPQHIDSPITHGVYLTGYLLLMTMLLRDGQNPPTGDAGGGRWDHRALPVDADYRPYAGSHRTSGLPREPRTNERYRPCRLLRHRHFNLRHATERKSQPLALSAGGHHAGDAAAHPKPRADHRPGAGGRLYAAPARLHPPQPADRRSAGRAGSAAFGHDSRWATCCSPVSRSWAPKAGCA